MGTIFAVLMLAPFACLAVTFFVTRSRERGAPVTAPGLLHGARVAAVPGEASFAGVYRSPARIAEPAPDPVWLVKQCIPWETRTAAAWCRFTGCIAGFCAPVIGIGLMVGRPGPLLVLGILGLAVAGGQLLARSALLRGSPSSPVVARVVGAWTLLHNLGILACIAACLRKRGDDPGDWKALQLDQGGLVFLMCACGSILLGLLLVHCAQPQRAWLEEIARTREGLLE